MINRPGLIYPTLPHGTPTEIQAAIKNVFDNLFYLSGRADEIDARIPKIPNPSTQPRQFIKSGIYNPTVTNILNLTSVTISACQWLEIQNPVPVITVSGKVIVDPIAAGSTKLGIQFPVPSNIVDDFQCCGVAFSQSVAGMGAAIFGDPVNNRAQMEWIAVDTALRAMAFIFTYRVV